MKDWRSIIQSVMKENKISQPMLAKQIGVTRAQVNHYLKGRSEPPLDKIKAICKALGTDFSIFNLENGKQDLIINQKIVNNFRYIPLLSWADTVKIQEALDKHDANEYLLAPKKICGDKSYALTVKGDAMKSTLYGEKSFQPGEVIIIDSEKTPENGSFVISLIDDKSEAIFKQYSVDGPLRYLKSLNTQYPAIPITNKIKIIGIVVGRVDYNLVAT